VHAEKPGTKRDQILMTAWRLFESQGYHATGINQIITESGVPKGSFYHYFPDGKEGLAIEAVEAISSGMSEKVREVCANDADCVSAIGGLFRGIAAHLEKSDYQHGGPLTTVALETATTNERLNLACREAYNEILRELVIQLSAGGFPEDDARDLSTMIVSGLEGGILLSRTFHSTDPMEQIARQMEAVMRNRQEASLASLPHNRAHGTDG
jgi:TetR/AcrR family transcriptional regulator, lmrAB and yxaGH operons repressor